MDQTAGLPAFASAAEANAHALALRERGDVRGAFAVFGAAMARFPHDASLLINIGFMLGEAGDAGGALRAYERAAACDPQAIEAHVSIGLLLFRAARNDEAEAAFARALALDPHELRANLAMYDLMHVKGEPVRALPYQLRALERRHLISRVAPHERRSVLVLCAPGDLQANIPVDFLFDEQTTTVHKLYLLDRERLAATALPPYDVAINAIAESPTAGAALALADAFLRAQGRPFINRPDRVLETNRLRLVEALRGVDCDLAGIARLTRDELRSGPLPFAYPLIVRPVGSHAGHGLARIADDAERAAYVRAADADAFFVSPFIDYRSADGLYRKYRIICVDGEPYPCHLAISPRWMIHYYNAAMAENAWMREEEARFLADLGSAFPPPLQQALRDVAAALQLDYFGIDCAIAGDGRLLIFEADPAMVVHVSDPVEIYPYKHRYVPRIFRALERMLDARAATERFLAPPGPQTCAVDGDLRLR